MKKYIKLSLITLIVGAVLFLPLLHQTLENNRTCYFSLYESIESDIDEEIICTDIFIYRALTNDFTFHNSREELSPLETIKPKIDCLTLWN